MQEKALEFLNKILGYLGQFDNYYIAEEFIKKYVEDFHNQQLSTIQEKEELCKHIEDFIESFDFIPKIFFLSVLIRINPKEKYYTQILEITLNESQLPINTKYFLLYQASSISFTDTKISSSIASQYKLRIYQQVYNNYKNRLNLEFIPKEQRNKDLIFIFTSQFLSLYHAPTKSAIDRAYNLKKLGKEVIIINTTEMLSQEKIIPFFLVSTPNIEKDYEKVNSFDYEGEKIPFFQCSNMPNIEGVQNLIDIVKEYKPYMALSIGSYNLTADLCSNLIPVGTIATVFSGLPTTLSQFHITGKTITQNDIDNLIPFGFNKDNLIHHLFTSSFQEQTNSYTKKDFNLPEDKTILAIVGARLHKELDNDFLNLILKTVKFNTHILFAGKYYDYELKCKENPELEKHSTFIGFSEDMLAVLELCDLYINPKRNGGGMSAVEALHKGVPVITYKHGDVYINVGDEFAINDDDELLAKIEEYITNKEYYESQVKIGKEKSIKLTNTKDSLEQLLTKLENNPLFK